MFIMLINVRKLLRLASFNKNGHTISNQFQEEKIKIGKQNINFLKVGNGPHHVLCMPGTLGTIWTDFKAQVEGMDREKFTIVTWDQPGFGKSRPPEKDFSPDFYEKDADTAYEFMQALGIPKYSILGWSGGGISGMIHAAKYPNTMNKLVVWGSSPIILAQQVETFRKIRNITTWSKEMRQPMLEIYGEELLAKYWSQWIDVMNKIYEQKNGNICSEFLKNIKCQTLILYGEKDIMVPKVHASHLHTHIEISRIHLYPEGKHNIHITHAEDFNRRVQEFLLLI